jgi:hypothetical protein
MGTIQVGGTIFTVTQLGGSGLKAPTQPRIVGGEK